MKKTLIAQHHTLGTLLEANAMNSSVSAFHKQNSRCTAFLDDKLELTSNTIMLRWLQSKASEYNDTIVIHGQLIRTDKNRSKINFFLKSKDIECLLHFSA